LANHPPNEFAEAANTNDGAHTSAARENAIAPARRDRIYSARGFFLELLVVTAGVLIALSLEGLREWNHYRSLAREARETIAREIADNKREIDGMLDDVDKRKENLETALGFADEMLKTKKTDIHTLDVGFTLAELSGASWQTAERTGALSHMEYSEVQKYSRLYAAQGLFAAQQRRTLERMTSAVAIVGGADDPALAPAKDLEMFRQQVLALRAEVFVGEQLARQLSELYGKALKP